MKNPFVKHDNSGTLAIILTVGAAIAGTFTYLYFARKKQEALDAHKEHATDYLKAKQPKKKKHKTDIHELEDLVHHIHPDPIQN